jgi:tetratricopeptide (TPR) repeat protein
MRLLHLDLSGRLVLTDFGGQSIPPYAILSHRWGEPNSEVLFGDIESNAYHKKDGYRKIEFCAKQAAQDQLKYFWIDTCCIDKWNLRELSSSINSMFRWYKNATRCYVLLSDVSVPSTHQQSDWEDSFSKSDWFHRGWTLQELIAPISVEFYSCEGQRIGDKTSLEQLLHEITSVPLAVLRNCPLDQFTITERMQWASNRETTEEEDIVYCLLGILNVSMPVSYDEGKEKALGRLLAEVGEASSAPSIIPFSQNDGFVGRESQLAKLEAKLFNDKQTTTFAIVGPGGTGKSQLALELAYRTKQNYQNCSVFWIDASNLDSLDQSYAGIAQKLNIPSWDDEKANPKQLVKLYLEGRGARQTLLIFDNTEEISLGAPGLSRPQAADLVSFLPRSELCSIVFTTTNANIAKRLASRNLVELQHLTPTAAQKMFEKYLDTLLSESEQQEAKLLLQELLYLPLAIAQAAACINNTKLKIPEYRSQMVTQMKHGFQHSNGVTDNKPRGYGEQNPITTTLFISIKMIQAKDPPAVDCLYLAACVDSKDVPLDLVQAYSHGKHAAVQILSTYKLVTRRPAESAFDLHRLVHIALREWLQRQGTLGRWTQNAIVQLLQVFPDHGDSNRSKWRRLLQHAKCAMSYGFAEGEDVEWLNLAWKTAMALYSDGRHSEAEELFVQVMETRKKKLGADHSYTLTSMANLASTYRNQGRWDVAEELFVQVMETSKKKLGADHPYTLTSMANLASTYLNQGRWDAAEELDVQVMETSKKKLGADHPDTLASMANLASTYRNQGRWDAAEELEVQVMETRKKKLGADHPDTLTSMANLASTYRNQGRLDAAEELEVQVMETRKKKLGADHPSTLTSMANLASTYWNQGRWDAAEELLVQVMETSKKKLGADHPGTLASMANLASTYRNQGRWDAAEELEVQVIETSRKKLGADHPDTLTSMNNLAFTWKAQGRSAEAVVLMRHCVQKCQQVLKAGNPRLESSLAVLEQWEAE